MIASTDGSSTPPSRCGNSRWPPPIRSETHQPIHHARHIPPAMDGSRDSEASHATPFTARSLRLLMQAPNGTTSTTVQGPFRGCQTIDWWAAALPPHPKLAIPWSYYRSLPPGLPHCASVRQGTECAHLRSCVCTLRWASSNSVSGSLQAGALVLREHDDLSSQQSLHGRGWAMGPLCSRR